MRTHHQEDFNHGRLQGALHLVDGQQPTAKMRGKSRIIPTGEEPPIWGFDGSSTEQAVGHASDCVLKPVFVCPDPIRGGENKLVLCEVFNTDMTPHASNTRAHLRSIAEQTASEEPWFGIEQEYTFFDGSRPLGWPKNGFPAPQGGYYCGVGADEVFGREIVEDHLDACFDAGLQISGINAEVMPAQWEFQVGPVGALEVADQLWIARWLLYRIAEDYGVSATPIPSPSSVTGTVPALTPTSPPRPCARATSPSLRAVKL